MTPSSTMGLYNQNHETHHRQYKSRAKRPLSSDWPVILSQLFSLLPTCYNNKTYPATNNNSYNTTCSTKYKNFKSATVYYGGPTRLIFSVLLLLYNSQAHDCMFAFQQMSPRQSELSGRAPQSDSQDRNSETKVTRMPYTLYVQMDDSHTGESLQLLLWMCFLSITVLMNKA